LNVVLGNVDVDVPLTAAEARDVGHALIEAAEEIDPPDWLVTPTVDQKSTVRPLPPLLWRGPNQFLETSSISSDGKPSSV
jgi:hypothetical protein